VLTFVYADARPPACDIVICAPVVKKEAAAQRKVLLAHYAHLTIHAMLHLHGYSHDNDVDAAQMEALETDLMVNCALQILIEQPALAMDDPRVINLACWNVFPPAVA